jgi:hypothetical protein
MEINSELFAAAEMHDTKIQIHLVSWYVDPVEDAEQGSERYGIYIGTENGGTLVAEFGADVPFDVAVSVFVAMGFSTIVDGSPRAAQSVQSLMDDTDETDSSKLVIPDTATVERITK